MAGSTVELFSTSILSNVKVRTRHERFTSVLAIKKIPYVYHDLASDDDAKSRWRRKAKDPQLPGILVDNEWVGSYDEFEEAVEFGELELFLGVSPAAAQAAPSAPHPAQSAVSSKDPSLYPSLPYASEGAGRWKEPDADQFISSLDLKEDELNEADVDALLADIGKLPSEPSSKADKKYVPSKEAAVKPLRLAKMGPSTSHQRMPSGSPSPSASAGTRASPIARYSATQRSTRALAAEAAALTSNRKTSGALLRDAVSQGKTLDDAMEESRMKHIVSQDNIDDLFASLGLSNVDIGDDEVDQFLEQGAIPQGLRLGGDRVHRPSSIADKARDEAVARDLALKAKEKGYGSARTSLNSDSTKLAALQPASKIGSTADDGSADASNVTSGLASALSKQVSTIPEAPSETSEAKQEELGKTADLHLTVKSGSLATDTPVSASEGEKSSDSTAKSADEDANSETAAKTTPQASDETPTLVAASGEPLEAAAQPKDTETQDTTTEAADGDDAAAEPAPSAAPIQPPATCSEDIGSNTKTEEEQREVTKAVEPSAGSDADSKVAAIIAAESGTSLTKEIEAAPSNEQVAETNEAALTSDDAQEAAATPAEADAPPSISALSHETAESPSKASTLPAFHAPLDEERTPTKEVSEDPIKAHAETATAEEPAADDHLFELELAQAASIASRFEDHQTGDVPSTEGQSSLPVEEQSRTELASSGSSSSLPNSGLPLTSPDKPASVAASAPSPSPVYSPRQEETKKEKAEGPLRVGTAPTGASTSRQASASSVSSSRRAIDVSRPIDPATSPPPPRSSSSDYSSSPEARKKKGIRGFGLGRDKDKEKDKDKEAANDKAAGTSRPGGGAWRHERTISQILREADAVLQMDDLEAGGSDDDDSEDPAMFGSSSVDIEAGAPSAVRTSSRPA